MKLRLLTWIALLVASLGLTEAANYNHHNVRWTWESYWLYFFTAVLTGIIVVAIIPVITKQKKDIVLSTALLFFIQLLEDMAFHISNFIITGRIKLYKPICLIIGFDFPIPIFWIIDVLAGSTLLTCYLVKTDIRLEKDVVLGVETA